MAIDEDKIKLLLELEGWSDIDTAIASLQHMKGAADGAQQGLESVAPASEAASKAVAQTGQAAAQAAPDIYELAAAEKTVAISTAQVAQAAQQAAPYLTQAEQEFEDLVRASVEATQAQKAMGQILDELKTKQVNVGAATGSLGLKLSDYRQNLVGLGYVVNDFTSVQGDLSQRLNAIANNLPMLLAGLGGLGLALSGIVPILGIVIKNWDHIKDAFNGTEPIVKTTGTLDEMKDSLKEVNKELETLATARFDSLANAERYNKLISDQLTLERNITEEKEKQARAAKLAALKPADETAEAKAKAKVLQDRLGGQQEGLINVVQEGLGDAEIQAKQKERDLAVETYNRLNAMARQGEVFDEFGQDIQKTLDKLEPTIEKADAELNKAIADRRQRATDIVGKAMLEGDAGAFGQLQQAVNAAADKDLGNPKLERFRKEIGRATPQGRQEMADAAKEAQQALDDQYKEAIDEFNGVAEMLTEAGKKNEAEFKRTEKEQQEVANNIKAVQEDMAQSRARFQEKLRQQAEQDRKAIDKFQKERADPDKAIQRQAAAQIQQTTGVDNATATEVAQRSLQLQKQGWDAINATQQAMAEMMAAQGGMMQQYQFLQQRAAMLTAEIRRMGARAANQDQVMPAMQFGWSF